MLDYLQVFIPVIALATDVLAQVILIRHLRVGLLRSVFAGAATGLACLAVIEVYCFMAGQDAADGAALAALNILTYGALTYCYFHFINLGETARRIRIMMEIYDSGTQGLTLDEILERYNAREIIEKRFKRLLDSGQVVLKDGHYFIGSPVMLLMSRAIQTVKIILLGKKSEFD